MTQTTIKSLIKETVRVLKNTDNAYIKQRALKRLSELGFSKEQLKELVATINNTEV